MKKDLSIADIILPAGILDLFEVVDVHFSGKDYHIFLDELANPPSDGGHYNSQGFTEQSVIQDFPVRGKPLFLHIRRRKWLNIKTKSVITSKFDLTQLGTQISQEFADFLKRGISKPNP